MNTIPAEVSAEIDRRLLAGITAGEIHRDLDVDHRAIAIRKKALAAAGATFAACACGRPFDHKGMCPPRKRRARERRQRPAPQAGSHQKRQFIAPRVRSSDWKWSTGPECEVITQKVDRIRDLILDLDQSLMADDDVARAAVILVAATMIGQHARALSIVTGDSEPFVQRVKNGALANQIFMRGYRGQYSMVDVTDWWAPIDGQAAILLDAMTCVGQAERIMAADGTVEYRRIAPVPAPEPPPSPPSERVAPAPPPKVVKCDAAPGKLDVLDGRWFRSLQEEEEEKSPVKIDGLEEASRERQAVLSAFRKAQGKGLEAADCYLAAAAAWLKIHPDHDRTAAAQRAAIIVLDEKWPEMLAMIRGRLAEIRP